MSLACSRELDCFDQPIRKRPRLRTEASGQTSKPVSHQPMLSPYFCGWPLRDHLDTLSGADFRWTTFRVIKSLKNKSIHSLVCTWNLHSNELQPLALLQLPTASSRPWRKGNQRSQLSPKPWPCTPAPTSRLTEVLPMLRRSPDWQSTGHIVGHEGYPSFLYSL